VNFTVNVWRCGTWSVTASALHDAVYLRVLQRW
jgi:hypothetical protein